MRLLSVLAVAMLASPAFATNLITNGSFEQGPAAVSFATFSAGSTAITGWTIASGSVDHINSYWNASAGNRSIDMNGNGPATLSQTINTIAGRSYTLRFDVSGNPDTTTLRSMNYSAGSLTGSYSTLAVNRPLVWVPVSATFVASSPNTLVSFAATSAGPWGVALDNVSVTLNAIPEPSTWVMLIAGFGLVGVSARRRRTVAA